MNHLQLTPRVLTRSRTALFPRRYSTSTPQQPRPITRPPPSSKVLPTVLLVGGAGAAGIGAYYYYDPNADVFKQARSALGLDPPTKSSAAQLSNAAKKVAAQPAATQQDKKPASPTEQKKPQVLRTEQVQKPPPPQQYQQQQKSTPTPVKAAVASAVAAMPLLSVPPPPLIASPAANKKEEEPIGDTVPKHVLITALRAQQEALSESHECKVKVIQQDYDRRLSNATSVIEAERVVDLRAKYEKASAALQAIEQGIEARTTQNARAKRLRALWAQVNALYARVNHPEYHDSITTSIDKKRLIASIQVPDKFVTQMVDSLPAGPVHSLESLKQRFYSDVQPVAKSVTLIKEGERFTLWKYAVGKLFGGAIVEVKREALQPDSKSPVQSTANALDSARCALERSDLLSAAIAVNQLSGLSRQVASDWLADARTLLETNQTLFVLMTYAASNNVF